MTDIGRLSNRILNSFERHKSEIVERQKLIDGSMKEMLERRERFAAVARQKLESVIHPRMEELLRHFDNGAITECHGDTNFHCICTFTHTPRFPATVSLDISVLPGESHTGLTTRYDLEILPVLMEYKRNDEMTFPLDAPDELVCLWVEEKIVEFIDTYLSLETHPLYQKDNIVSDPICGMQISAIAATSAVELTGHTFYFCSEVCKAAFLEKRK
jgi:YHS domain-containing protein